MDSGYDTIATRLNLATVLQALDQYSEAEKVLKDLQEQYPSDYRFDMQMAYLPDRPAPHQRMAQIRRNTCVYRTNLFVVGIVDMIVSAVAAVVSAWIPAQQEKS